MFWISFFVPRNLSHIVAVGIVLGLSLVLPQASNADQIDLGSLLEDMLDRSRIAEFPEPAFACK